jgi:hypothetical protein
MKSTQRLSGSPDKSKGTSYISNLSKIVDHGKFKESQPDAKAKIEWFYYIIDNIPDDIQAVILDSLSRMDIRAFQKATNGELREPLKSYLKNLDERFYKRVVEYIQLKNPEKKTEVYRLLVEEVNKHGYDIDSLQAIIDLYEFDTLDYDSADDYIELLNNWLLTKNSPYYDLALQRAIPFLIGYFSQKLAPFYAFLDKPNEYHLSNRLILRDIVSLLYKLRVELNSPELIAILDATMLSIMNLFVYKIYIPQIYKLSDIVIRYVEMVRILKKKPTHLLMEFEDKFNNEYLPYFKITTKNVMIHSVLYYGLTGLHTKEMRRDIAYAMLEILEMYADLFHIKGRKKITITYTKVPDPASYDELIELEDILKMMKSLEFWFVHIRKYLTTRRIDIVEGKFKTILMYRDTSKIIVKG